MNSAQKSLGKLFKGALVRGKEHQGKDSGQHTQSLPFGKGLIPLAAEGVGEVPRLVISSLP